jgi:hypothetical protein
MRLEGFLPGASYYFRLRTFTPAHQSGPRGNIWVGQQNDLWSEFTLPLGLTFGQVQPEITSSLTITDASNTAVTVVVPPGSVTSTVTLGFATREAVTDTAGLSFASLSFDLTAFENGQPLPEFTFAEPLTVTIRYSDQDIAGLNEQSLLLFYWDEAQHAWVDAASTCTPRSAYQRHPQDNWLALPICHLSTFGLFSLDGQQLYLPVMKN